MVFILFIQTFISSYLIVRGTTLIVNLGFPNEMVLMSSVSNETNGLVKLPTMFYVYSATILGIWGGSFYIQLKKEIEDDTLGKGFDEEEEDLFWAKKQHDSPFKSEVKEFATTKIKIARMSELAIGFAREEQIRDAYIHSVPNILRFKFKP